MHKSWIVIAIAAVYICAQIRAYEQRIADEYNHPHICSIKNRCLSYGATTLYTLGILYLFW